MRAGLRSTYYPQMIYLLPAMMPCGPLPMLSTVPLQVYNIGYIRTWLYNNHTSIVCRCIFEKCMYMYEVNLTHVM